ncbi:MAG: DUF1592 domain-containing protein [Verrucomicrobia bacterium]|nr:DUF1592 domain-containing protein [Verrucomicrobiota bacterium]
MAHITLVVLFVSIAGVVAQTSSTTSAQYDQNIRPLINEFCLKCHSTEKHKGDLDLERFTSSSEVLKHAKVWERVIEQLNLGEMPPQEKPQPTPEQRRQLLDWVNRALDEAALVNAGDPGPVVLRRLNNAEYTYTVRDLTGVESLDPVKEFPADSAAGEGFMNTGNALVMSPSFVTKYLDAGKDIASHAVLLPDGLRFSSGTTRRDWTEELLAEIRGFYSKFTEVGGAETVTQQGMELDKNKGGRLPLEKYLAATLELRQNAKQLQSLARQRELSPKYLAALWNLLNDKSPSLLLDPLRVRWRVATHADVASLAADITQWQKVLWKFSSVGHIGKVGGPKAWMEPVSPLSSKQEVRLKLAAPTNGNEVVLYLVAGDAGDGNENDFVIWQQPKLVVPGQPDLLLRDVRDFTREITARREKIFATTAKCLTAAAEASASTNNLDVAELSRRHGVETEMLSPWLDYLGIGSSATIKLDHFTAQIHKSSGYDFVNGWGSSETPLLLANSSDQHVRIPGNMKPHGVTVHPSPTLNAAVGWRSPLVGPISIEAKVTHAHPECGNGVEWFLELRRGATRQRLANGTSQGGKEVKVGPVENLSIQTGDLVSLLIGPRDGNHSCDLTDIELVIKSAGDGGREWSLTRDVSPDVLASNPHADRFGNEGVWHFYTEAVSGRETGPMIPSGSLLAKWQSAGSVEDKLKLAQAVQNLLTSAPSATKDDPDTKLYQQLASLRGPLFAGARNSNGNRQADIQSPTRTQKPAKSDTEWGVDPAVFGKHPSGSAIDANSLCVRAPSVLEFRLPADLVAGAEFVTTGILDPASGAEGSVQLQALTTKPTDIKTLLPGASTVQNSKGTWTDPDKPVIHSTPIVIVEGSATSKRIESNLDEFRHWFPAALCYTKIVPVDEVVTLTLLHREDDHLSQLMLDDAQKAKLNRLWEELHYISQDALTLVDAFEQLWQYATQDADPKVFEPMRKPINDRAAVFRQLLTNTQPQHVQGVLEFAGRAYRRPLTADEQVELRGLYQKLRKEELPHDEAIRLTLARVFVSPAFLYRLEKAAPGAKPGPVSDWELASRLSYFLWSSMPDPELREVAAGGKLHNPDVLVAQAKRMLPNPKVRRLATEFACAWLHIHDFESLDEKSEKHFPTFAALRGPMYEEAIQFFADSFQNNASVLSFFDTDHTFLNESLAQHYGISGVTGSEWRRVDGVKKFGRGGILGMGATLAKQSGASRTSPILRGNWFSEVLLGEKLPRPPKDVPRLPEDEATETLTVRQLTEKHTSDPRCAGCHARMDGYGYALEGYDAIGRARTRDLADRPIDTRSKLFDGTQVEGANDLRDYLLTRKRDLVLRQFCRKLLGYALGRSVMLSDKPLVTEMQRQLETHDYSFNTAVETVVRSKQFREIRGRDTISEE